jgi:NAD(P)-dependent dehydrogenase (short-subunit alcohol dehydrogenase family)
MSDLTDLIALVTGGGAGIGAACSRTLAAAGATVVVADRDRAAADAVALGILAHGGKATSATVDVADSASVNALVDSIVAEHGRLDIGVNNAGIGGAQLGIAELTDAEWAETRSINLDGVFYCMRAEILQMKKQGGGVIVNMASILSVVAWPEAAPYIGAKHGVLGLTRSGAIDYAADGIRVNAVGPGFISTDLVKNGLPPETYEMLASMHPIGRMGTPEEVAKLVLFLASDESSNMTGGYYPVDGGYTIR